MRFLLALLIAAPLAAQSRIDGDVAIRLRDSTLHATLHYDYVALDDGRTIDLLINKSFSVPKASCPVCGAHRIENDDPAILHIDLTTPVAKGTHVPLTIEYEGSIADSYKRDVEFLERSADRAQRLSARQPGRDVRHFHEAGHDPGPGVAHRDDHQR